MDSQGTSNTQNNLEKKNKVGAGLQNLLQSYSNQNTVILVQRQT